MFFFVSYVTLFITEPLTPLSFVPSEKNDSWKDMELDEMCYRFGYHSLLIGFRYTHRHDDPIKITCFNACRFNSQLQQICYEHSGGR